MVTFAFKFLKKPELFSFLFQMEYWMLINYWNLWFKVYGNIQIILTAYPLICLAALLLSHCEKVIGFADKYVI